MKQKFWIVPAGAALGLACGCGWLILGTGAWTALTAPLTALGEGLRGLSLGSFGGNLGAWGVVILLSALPLLALVLLKRERRGAEDWLLGLMAPVIFLGLFFLVNPTHLSWPVREFLPPAALGTALSMALAFLVLKALRVLEGTSREKLAWAFEWLLCLCAGLTAFAAVFGQALEGMSRWNGVVEGNTDPGSLTPLMIAFLCCLEAAPGLLSALTMVWGAALAKVLGRADFDREGVELCGRAALCCRVAAQATVVLGVSANLIQLALMELLRTTHFSLALPLLSLMLSAGLMLLCSLLQRGWELQEDSDSII